MTDDYPCGSGSLAEPFVYAIGATTERRQCGGCGRHLQRTAFTYYAPDICFSCRNHGRRMRGEWR